MESSLLNVRKKFTFLWNITNLAYCKLVNGECISSPKFTVPQFNNTTWCLEVYPKGYDKESENFLSFFICKTTSNNNIKIKFKFLVPLLSVSNTGEHVFSQKTESYGSRKFLCQDLKDSYNDSLIIECQMQMYDAENGSLSNIDSFILTCLSDSNPQISKIPEAEHVSIDTFFDKMKGEIIAYPRRCFAHSEILSDKKLVVWPIDLEVVTGSKLVQKIPAFCVNSLLFIISLFRIRMDYEYLGMEINFVNVDFEIDFLLACKVYISDSADNSIHSLKEEYIFDMEKQQGILHFDRIFQVKDLVKKINCLSSNHLYLNLELTFSFGEIHSSIKWEEGSKYFSNYSAENNPVNLVSTQSLNQYLEKKFYADVFKTFDVSKSNPCAMSSEFPALFGNDTTEIQTKDIGIEDIYENPYQMFSDLDTERLEKLKFKSAINMYITADKYQILQLKQVCRDFLMENISVVNVCLFLSFAHAHNDLKLRNAAVKFLTVYKNSVLLSPEWKSFTDENLPLAENILRDVCLNL